MKTLLADADKESQEEILTSLSEHMPKVKAIAANYKKPAASDKQQADWGNGIYNVDGKVRVQVFFFYQRNCCIKFIQFI